MAMLAEHTVEGGPSALTAFIQVVALHKELRRERWLFRKVAVFELQPGLNLLDITHRVAAATTALVTDRSSEVEPTNVTEVPRLRDHVVGNVVRLVELGTPLLSIRDSGLVVSIIDVWLLSTMLTLLLIIQPLGEEINLLICF
jgi:hypothetical protein